MEKKLKPIGDCIVDMEGLLLDKTGNTNSSLGSSIHDIFTNSKNLIKNTDFNDNDENLDSTTIEVVFDKSILVIKNDASKKITAAGFGGKK